jgi:hypothetical protein
MSLQNSKRWASLFAPHHQLSNHQSFENSLRSFRLSQSLPLKQNQRRRLQQRKLLLKKQLPMSWKRR